MEKKKEILCFSYFSYFFGKIGEKCEKIRKNKGKRNGLFFFSLISMENKRNPFFSRFFLIFLILRKNRRKILKIKKHKNTMICPFSIVNIEKMKIFLCLFFPLFFLFQSQLCFHFSPTFDSHDRHGLLTFFRKHKETQKNHAHVFLIFIPTLCGFFSYFTLFCIVPREATIYITSLVTRA